MAETNQRPPDRTWQLQEAKAKLSELVEKALSQGPQRVTRHGKDSVIVISEREYWGVRERPSLYETLRSSPFVADHVELDLERSKDLPREFDL
jgi:antitoxin Phd